MSSAANKIDANDKSLRDVLHSKKYSVDFFQREYKWQRKHIEQLLIDIEEAFNENYKLGDKISDISSYNSYYMGPVIFYDKAGVLSVIDGQQRLTSLTLLLIYIHNLQKDLKEIEPVNDLIFSRKHGRNSFNLEVPERFDVLDALYNDKDFDLRKEKNLSVINTFERYQDIKEIFPDNLKKNKLPLFIDWLKEKLIFVEIIAYSDRNAYTIFETMNDRGYNLTPSEMLKGLLLSKINNEEYLLEINDIWREKVSELHYFSVDEDLEFFRGWLRGQYAETMKKSSMAGTAREDFEKIGTSFHRWVKENTKKLKLKSEESYYYFVKGDFVFYCDLYKKIRQLERTPVNNLELVNYLSNYSIATSISYPLYISPVKKLDSEEIINTKLLLIAEFIDRFIVYRSLNNQPISQTSIRYFIFNNVIKEVRGLDSANLVEVLNNVLESKDRFNHLNIPVFSLNRKFLRYFLARITHFLNIQCGIDSDFYDLISARRKTGSTVESIISFEERNNQSLFKTNEMFNKFYFNIANYTLKGKNSLEKDGIKENILFRILATGELSSLETSILSTKFSLPTRYKPTTEDWLYQRHTFLKQVCEEIWGTIELPHISLK